MSELARLRAAKGLTQAELATKVGTSQPQIRRLENGERKLTKEWAKRLAPALDTTAEAILFPGQDSRGLDLARKLKLLRPDLAETLEDQFDALINQALEKQQRTTR
ncbi:MAG: helix-turn-helix transcriptional regulator [Mesorhizobium sp.]|nr:MAG: helix-turn-helix transcriptional regulator [Mesorhizobium sp.]